MVGLRGLGFRVLTGAYQPSGVRDCNCLGSGAGGDHLEEAQRLVEYEFRVFCGYRNL